MLILEVNNLMPLGEILPDLLPLDQKWKPIGELHVQCLMLIILRMLFGLDDVTEKFQSKYARVLNSVIDKAEKAYARKQRRRPG